MSRWALRTRVDVPVEGLWALPGSGPCTSLPLRWEGFRHSFRVAVAPPARSSVLASHGSNAQKCKIEVHRIVQS